MRFKFKFLYISGCMFIFGNTISLKKLFEAEDRGELIYPKEEFWTNYKLSKSNRISNMVSTQEKQKAFSGKSGLKGASINSENNSKLLLESLENRFSTPIEVSRTTTPIVEEKFSKISSKFAHHDRINALSSTSMVKFQGLGIGEFLARNENVEEFIVEAVCSPLDPQLEAILMELEQKRSSPHHQFQNFYNNAQNDVVISTELNANSKTHHPKDHSFSNAKASIPHGDKHQENSPNSECKNESKMLSLAYEVICSESEAVQRSVSEHDSTKTNHYSSKNKVGLCGESCKNCPNILHKWQQFDAEKAIKMLDATDSVLKEVKEGYELNPVISDLPKNHENIEENVSLRLKDNQKIVVYRSEEWQSHKKIDPNQKVIGWLYLGDLFQWLLEGQKRHITLERLKQTKHEILAQMVVRMESASAGMRRQITIYEESSDPIEPLTTSIDKKVNPFGNSVKLEKEKNGGQKILEKNKDLDKKPDRNLPTVFSPVNKGINSIRESLMGLCFAVISIFSLTKGATTRFTVNQLIAWIILAIVAIVFLSAIVLKNNKLL